MKTLIFVFVLITNFNNLLAADSKPISLNMQLNIDNKIVVTPKVSIAYGKTARIEQQLFDSGETLVVEIVPSEGVKSGTVNLAFKIAEIKKGVESTLSRPQVVAKLGSSTRLTQKSQDPNVFKVMDLEVVAK